jgi:hypothetical protein
MLHVCTEPARCMIAVRQRDLPVHARHAAPHQGTLTRGSTCGDSPCWPSSAAGGCRPMGQAVMATLASQVDRGLRSGPYNGCPQEAARMHSKSRKLVSTIRASFLHSRNADKSVGHWTMGSMYLVRHDAVLPLCSPSTRILQRPLQACHACVFAVERRPVSGLEDTAAFLAEVGSRPTIARIFALH